MMDQIKKNLFQVKFEVYGKSEREEALSLSKVCFEALNTVNWLNIFQ